MHYMAEVIQLAYNLTHKCFIKTTQLFDQAFFCYLGKYKLLPVHLLYTTNSIPKQGTYTYTCLVW